MEMLNLQIQIFLLLAIGFALGKSEMISKSTVKQLNALVMNLILPASIVRSFQADLTPDILQSTLLVLVLSIIIQFVSVFLSKILWVKVKNPDERLNMEYGTVANNAGTLGMVVAEAAFGSAGLLYSSIYMIPVRIMMWSFGIALYSKNKNQNRWEGLKKVFLHPCLIAIYLGLILMIGGMYGFTLPAFAQKTLDSLANCNTALVMIVIGTILSELSIKDIIDKNAFLYTFVRLLAFPALVFVCLKFFPLAALPINICIIETAMPAPVTMVMMAQKYKKDEQFASKIVFVSTLASLITLPLWTWLFTLPLFQ